MKSTSAFLFSILTLFVTSISAQNNVGIGTISPSNKLEVHGNLLVTAPTVSTNTPPTMAQTKTMMSNTAIVYAPTDSTGRFFDPGGPTGDYSPGGSDSYTCNIDLQSMSSGIEFIIENIDIGIGDSLIVRTSSTGQVLLAVGNGYMTPGEYIFNSASLYVRFKPNPDAFVGSGFSILFKRLYPVPDQPEVSNFSGNTFYFDAKNGSLRSGTIANTEVGANSLSVGAGTVASGYSSVALGVNTYAGGSFSTAIGAGSVAVENGAIAMGIDANAVGYASIAMGLNAVANGHASIALGIASKAQGEYSIAMGSGAEAYGKRATSTGYFSIANGFAGTVIGTYNDPLVDPQNDISSNTPLFIIGNGDDENNRSNAMVVRKDGHVGIGANAPKVRLHVANGEDASYGDEAGFAVIGNVNNLNLVFDDNEFMARDNGAVSDLYIQKDGGKVFVGATDTPNFLFNVNGTAGKPGGGFWAALSDSRLKENVHPYSDGLSAILKIDPVRFQYNERSGYDTKPEYIGVIAQELQEVAPYMVTISENTLADGTTDILTVDNSAMTYMLINAVKELNQENEILEQEQAAIQNALVNQQDLLSVNLMAVQALEKSTKEQEMEIQNLKRELCALKAEMHSLSR